MTAIRITDDTTRGELEETLRHLATFAAHQLHHVDNAKWTSCHEHIDTPLEEWEAKA